MALHVVRELRARRRASAWLACVAVFLGGLLVGVLMPAGGSSAARDVLPVRHMPVHAVRVGGTLPEWRAPGAPLTVTGWTGPSQRVSLVVGGRRVATARSGALGRFEVTGRVGRAGRPLVEVTSEGRRLRAGKLLVRPVLLAAA